MRWRIGSWGWLVSFLLAAGLDRAASGDDRPEPKRMVLVELYSSQGCDMCPAAEEILGRLAASDHQIVPIAFHVDYFNKPWKDVFSDELYSQRQMTYNQLYTRPKNPDYGLYYTPMLMIDGVESVNGRDPVAAGAAIRQALARKPAVGLDVTLDVKADGLTGTATMNVTSRSPRVERTPLLICAVLREDGVTTLVGAGENRGKSLVARFPARQTRFDFLELDGRTPGTRTQTFTVDPAWTQRNLRLAVFVQDKRTGVVYQAADLPWRSTPSEPGSSKSERKPATSTR